MLQGILSLDLYKFYGESSFIQAPFLPTCNLFHNVQKKEEQDFILSLK